MLLKRDGYSAPFPLYMIPLYYTLMLFAKSSRSAIANEFIRSIYHTVGIF